MALGSTVQYICRMFRDVDGTCGSKTTMYIAAYLMMRKVCPPPLYPRQESWEDHVFPRPVGDASDSPEKRPC